MSNDIKDEKRIELKKLIERHGRGAGPLLTKHLEISKSQLYTILSGKSEISTERLIKAGELFNHDFRPFLDKRNIPYVVKQENKETQGNDLAKKYTDLLEKHNALLEKNNALINLIATKNPELLKNYA